MYFGGPLRARAARGWRRGLSGAPVREVAGVPSGPAPGRTHPDSAPGTLDSEDPLAPEATVAPTPSVPAKEGDSLDSTGTLRHRGGKGRHLRRGTADDATPFPATRDTQGRPHGTPLPQRTSRSQDPPLPNTPSPAPGITPCLLPHPRPLDWNSEPEVKTGLATRRIDFPKQGRRHRKISTSSTQTRDPPHPQQEVGARPGVGDSVWPRGYGLRRPHF